MPEPNRLPWRIDPEIAQVAFWRLIEQRITVVLECTACHHKAEWPPNELERLFRRQSGKTLAWYAHRLRCRACRSEWVSVAAKEGGRRLGLSEFWRG
jgi:transcriptional regulator GlxA family with amidase domain